ncbi:MAG: nuclear transport factor 2 family protein [Pedobacter sp.]|nr:MAG: nuclear transport factor 2 family protein [Pedobacter sp.]
MDSQFLRQLQDVHLSIWKEKDADKRAALMPSIYSENIRMFDRDFILNGNQEISDFISKLHSADGHFEFAASRPIEATQHCARLFWTIQTKATGEPMTGMDMFIIENERVTQLFVFIDHAAPKL